MTFIHHPFHSLPRLHPHVIIRAGSTRHRGSRGKRERERNREEFNFPSRKCEFGDHIVAKFFGAMELARSAAMALLLFASLWITPTLGVVDDKCAACKAVAVRHLLASLFCLSTLCLQSISRAPNLFPSCVDYKCHI